MRTWLRGKFTLLFMTCAVVLAIPAIALADDISNNLDASVDAVAENMPLTVGGANGTTNLYVIPQSGDGKNGCNFGGTTGTLQLAVSSSNPSVATVSPSSVTFSGCGQTPLLTVTPQGAGTATINVSQTSNTTDSTFNLAPAKFDVTVTDPTPVNTAPTVAVAGVAGGASYNKGSVPAATCQVTDAEDGNSSFAATLSAITGTYASDGIGQQTASCDYTDGGGLNVQASETYNIVDPSAPVITKVVTPASPDGANGWYKSNVTVDWTVTENESPNSLQTTGCVDQSITSDQQATTYSCSATSAGGSSGPVNVSIKRDGTAPVISGSDITETTWRNSALSANFTASDATSGLANIADASFSLSTSGDSPNATTPVTDSKTVSDNAGNSDTRTISAFVDTVKPTVSVTGVSNGATYTLGNVPTAGCSTGDALSGVKTNASLQQSGGPVGSVTATCSGAEDKAGNTNSASVTYKVLYSYSGALQPINTDGSSIFKAGSTVPVKFYLTGASAGITDAAISLKYVKIDNGIAGDETEAVTNVAATTGSLFRYSEGQYIYNWSTKGLTQGTYELRFVLPDGTVQGTATVSLKK